MKYILYTLLAASISMTACRKSETAAPVSSTTDEAINDCRARAVNGYNKQTASGLEMDYDLLINEVSKNKYSVKLKMNGLTLNGKKVPGYKPDGYNSVSVVIKSTTADAERIAVLDLVEDERGRNTFVSPEFGYKGDLDYELVDVTIKMAIKGGTVTISEDIKVDLAGFVITVAENTKNGGNGTITFEYTNTGSEPMISFTTFSILFNNVRGEGKYSISDDGLFFVLPSGDTKIEEPTIAKVHRQTESDGTYGYITATVKGDPALLVSTVTYQPKPVSANDPKDPKAMIVFPVMKFERTHVNQKNGVQRFKSVQTWQEMYGNEKVSPLYDAKGMEVTSALYQGGH